MIELQEFPTRILVVDDNERTREALRLHIAVASPSFIVDTAKSGPEALERLGQRGFDVMLCDLRLKGTMDGIAVTKAIQERHPQVRVVVFSGIDEGRSKVDVLNAGAFSYLSKPINHDELLHAIRTVNKVRRTERLHSWFETLTRISYDLQATFDFDRIARRIVLGVQELGYARARLYVFDREQQRLIGKEARGMPADLAFERYRIPFAASPVMRRIFESDRPLFCNRKAILEQFQNEATEPWMSDLELADVTWCDCPLLVRSEHVGLLSVDNLGRPGYRFTEEDRQILGFFSRLAAQALNNSQLYEKEALVSASLRSILHEAPDTVITTDAAGTINFVSPSSERVLGYTAEEMLGKKAEDFYVDEQGTDGSGKPIARDVMVALRGGSAISNRRLHLRAKGGGQRPISLSVSLLHGPRGEVLGTLGILKDLGPLEEQARQYRDVLEGFGYGTLLLDPSGRIRFVNRKAERLLRRSCEQLVEKNFLTFVAPTQSVELAARLSRVRAARTEESLDLSLTLPTGQRLPVKAILTPDRADRSPSAVAVGLYDKSELGALIQSGRLMALGQMVAGVAHEVNNPLNHILLATSQLQSDGASGDDPGDDAPDAPDYLAMIQRNGQRIRAIVQQLREFARPADFAPQPIALNDAIAASVAFFTTRFRNHNIELALDLASDLPPVFADAKRLQQVFVNLIVNAEEAMEDQVEAKRVRITSSLTASGRVAVTVSDSGPGIPEEIRDAIFDPFFTTKPPSQGTGLGLSITKSILDLHEGSIRAAEAEGGRGAAFVLELPPHAGDTGSERAS